MNTSGFMHSIDATKKPQLLSLPAVVLICIVTIILGASGGYMMVKKSSFAIGSNTGAAVQTDTSSGVVDKSTFKEGPIGLLKEGGIEGEGSFHLERTGGESQNVYLTSSTVDLSKYVGKKVKVWGQTLNAQKAGWFMDVGLVEIQ